MARGDRKWSLNDGQISNFRGVRVAPGTRYHRVEGNRRAKNGLVSDLPPEIPTVTIRNFCIGVRRRRLLRRVRAPRARHHAAAGGGLGEGNSFFATGSYRRLRDFCYSFEFQSKLTGFTKSQTQIVALN
jgi:hypothetical protein